MILIAGNQLLRISMLQIYMSCHRFNLFSIVFVLLLFLSISLVNKLNII